MSTGMAEKKRTLLDINPADRARLLASATAYAAGRRILLHCAFRHDMGGDAGLWTRLLDDPPEEIDGQWRAIAARDLYEAGYAPQGAPEPPIQHLKPLGDAGDPAWADVYLALVGGGR